jgi:thiol-disulfide isomerase/thioredoxin
MKHLLIVLTFAYLFCLNLNAQTLNQEFIKDGKAAYLIGKVDKNGLQSDNYNTWFSKNYNAYATDSKIIDDLKSKLKDYKILLFMGTWCGDSKREVPKFYKILDACNYPMDQLTTIAVSRESGLYKESPQHEEAGLNIVRVPTFIFYKNEKEINRIIEHPIKSLEKDVQSIINSNTYKSNYYDVKKALKSAKKATP